MASDKVRVAVIGMGGMGVGHANAYRGDPRCEIVAVCDQSKTWADKAKKEFGAKYAFTTFEEVAACEAVDAVSVCLPALFHEPASVACLDAGKHVLCEKPMTTSVASAKRMARAVKRSGKVFLIGHNQRFGPDIQFLKEYIEAGNLGEVYFARTAWRRPMGMLVTPTARHANGEVYSRNWFNERKMGGGVGWDLGSHVLDLVLYFMDFPKVKEVTGCAYTKFGPEMVAGQDFVFDVDDHTVGFVKFENGASLQVEMSFGSYVEREQILQAVYGTKGGALRDWGQPMKLFSRTGDTYTTVLPRIDKPGTSPMAHFVDCILNGTPPLVTADQGVIVTEIISGIYESGEEG
jgi:predicted dehydrogenase